MGNGYICIYYGLLLIVFLKLTYNSSKYMDSVIDYCIKNIPGFIVVVLVEWILYPYSYCYLSFAEILLCILSWSIIFDTKNIIFEKGNLIKDVGNCNIIKVKILEREINFNFKQIYKKNEDLLNFKIKIIKIIKKNISEIEILKLNEIK